MYYCDPNAGKVSGAFLEIAILWHLKELICHPNSISFEEYYKLLEIWLPEEYGANSFAVKDDVERALIVLHTEGLIVSSFTLRGKDGRKVNNVREITKEGLEALRRIQ